MVYFYIYPPASYFVVTAIFWDEVIPNLTGWPYFLVLIPPIFMREDNATMLSILTWIEVITFFNITNWLPSILACLCGTSSLLVTSSP